MTSLTPIVASWRLEYNNEEECRLAAGRQGGSEIKKGARVVLEGRIAEEQEAETCIDEFEV